MAKLNEGDVIEGIFCIAIGLYIAHGQVSKQELNKIRAKVDTSMFNSGRFKYSVAKNLKRKHKNKPVDIFNVSIEMRLKSEQSVKGAFGKEFDVLYKKSKDVGNIDKKITQLIASISNASYISKINKAINSFLDNNFGEVVEFVVVADGVAGESTGGEIKGDITISIYAQRKTAKKKILSEEIPFSLKSESVTVANLSPYEGMLSIAKALGIKWDAKEKYIQLTKKATTNAEKNQKFKLINLMYKELKQEISKKSSSAKFSNDAFEFLSKSIFGRDLADVIDIRSGGVKEITKEYFDNMQKTTKLIVEERGNNLVFLDKKDSTPIFQLRTKLRPPPANEAKFYLEVGAGSYKK